MRNYRFRGWSKLQQKWIYGSLITSPKSGEIYIGNSTVYEPVEPGSVGQLTEFWTDDTQDIYEGDVLLVSDGEESHKYPVVWDKDKAMWCCDVEDGYTPPLGEYSMNGYSIFVIGNLWEKKKERIEKTREYKFRGWSKWRKEWIYGDLIGACGVGNISIRNSDGFAEPVEPGSIGQSIGLRTDDIQDIYEGDIIQTHNKEGIYDGKKENEFIVYWNEDWAMWCGDNGDGALHVLYILNIEDCTLIIGNKWEKGGKTMDMNGFKNQDLDMVE